jgi:hypothetical protein
MSGFCIHAHLATHLLCDACNFQLMSKCLSYVGYTIQVTGSMTNIEHLHKLLSIYIVIMKFAFVAQKKIR